MLRPHQTIQQSLLGSGTQRSNGFRGIQYSDKVRRQINRKGRADQRLRNMEIKCWEVRLHNSSTLHICNILMHPSHPARGADI